MIATVRAAYFGGPLDGRVDNLPMLDDGPAHVLVLESIDLDALLEWNQAGALGDPPVAGRTPGEYHWLAHVAPVSGPAFERYQWQEGGH